MRDKGRYGMVYTQLQQNHAKKRCKLGLPTAIPVILCWIIAVQVLFMLFGASTYQFSYGMKRNTKVYDVLNGINGSLLSNATTRNAGEILGDIAPTEPYVPIPPRLHRDPQEALYYRPRKESVNIHNFTYLINPGPCRGSGVPYLLVFVFSIYNKQGVRQAIRDTWGSVARTGYWPGEEIKHKVRVYFLLGNCPQAWRDIIRNESGVYRDIIQEDFQESYANLTIKSVMALKWTRVFCPEANYVMKSDDDMIINIPAILDYLDNHKDLENTLIGALNGKSRVYRAGRWGVSRKSFPFTFYPPYMAGNAYLMSGKLATKLYETSKYVALIKIEDVYVTGILPYVLGKQVKHRKHKGFSDWLGKVPNHCDIMKRRKLTATKMTAENLATPDAIAHISSPDGFPRVWLETLNDTREP
ncbi:beta-1,3-galactosyltransferase 1-like [Lineus longissimus]|uniref:beta-1,3-galactosyltransferase 1-like n=1 Tax=Lineus longissimus TaxID=88925 RepID=UPI002B4F4233